ncbi:hypothetical protein GCM10007907_31840 [Chitinimonas prasina]|uniref:CHASE2 domain-containing protein n=1 Tax=Chitinimonas prasina TaxID=1434937 RepID=A0ABQ5YIC7_9NEIS|nr:CHASE2 domain-containing protein [Chitinimonas prasina]GLR14394.1 hypothetical protein GCM10007907_31840 [Chitinimonas prasina]
MPRRGAVATLLQARRGRPLALLLLLALLGFQQLSPQSGLPAARLALFDLYQHTWPRQPQGQPVTLVEIDEPSLQQLGQWPWPRNKLARLIDAINTHRPLAIGLDLYMPELDQTSPAMVARNLPTKQADLATTLAALPSHEAVLVQSLQSAPVVLGAAGFDYPTLSTTQGLRSQPVQVQGGDPLPWLRAYPWVLASLPQLQAAATGQAVLSVDLDGGVVRRMPLAVSVNQQPVPSLAMEMLRVATGVPAVTLVVDQHGIREARVADLIVPTLPNGEVWLPFAPARHSRSVSAAQVLSGRVDPTALQDKLVLIGITGFGLTDLRATPLDAQVPGVEIQAQLMESLIAGQFLQRPAWMRHLEGGVLLLAGLLLIAAVPRTRLRWLAPGTAVLFSLVAAAGFAGFRYGGLLFDAASILISLCLLLGSLLSSRFLETDAQRRQAQQALQHERELAAKVAGELAAARRLQLGSLPDATRQFPGETRFQLAAVLEPAREVGGDLYDFFMLSPDHLFFIVGDVSGKGLPASLFMVVAKALGKSIALRGEDDITAIIGQLNQELARENPETLFITVVAGILDVATGKLHLINAGHDAPWLRRSNGSLTQLRGAGGPPLCILEDFPYPVQAYQLAVGDTLCVITDGITEAMNAQSELYGMARLEAVLTAMPIDAALERMVSTVQADVQQFVGDAPPSDDLTLLLLRRNS